MLRLPWLAPAIFSPNSTFLRTESQGNSEYCWNTTPRSDPGRVMGLPSSIASPSVGLTKPATMLSRVDLPQPEGPISETNSPGWTLSETSLTATTALSPLPKVTPMLRMSMKPLRMSAICVDHGHRLLPDAKASHGIKRTPTIRMMPLHARPRTPIVIMPSMIAG